MTGCLKGPGFMSRQVPAASAPAPAASAPIEAIQATILGASASGKVKASDSNTQVLTAAPQSSIAGSQASFPPGTLAVDTNVTIAPGPSLANNAVATQLGLGTTLASSGSAVAVTSSVPTDATQPFTLAIPLPDNGNSLALGNTDAYANLIIIYTVTTASGSVLTGIILRDLINIVNGFANFSTLHFGTYQAVVTVAPVVQSVQIAAAPVETTPPARIYFVSGPASASFGGVLGQSVSGFQGWVHKFSPAQVGGPTTLTVDRTDKFKTTAVAH